MSLFHSRFTGAAFQVPRVGDTVRRLPVWPTPLAVIIFRPIQAAAMQETLVRFLGREDPLEKGKATHSSILAWTVPWII